MMRRCWSLVLGVTLLLFLGCHGTEDVVRSLSMKKDKIVAQRAFMITHIEDRGFLLMEAYKKEKGLHSQLPGGRIDAGDFEALGLATDLNKVTFDELVRVGQHAALRELWEETRIDLKAHYERLQYLPTVTEAVANNKRKLGRIPHSHFPLKLYYFLELRRDEFNGSKIKLSSEHVGYRIESNIVEAARSAKQHSGGDSAVALEVFERELSIFFARK
eukprot:Gregarina_sp_Poly_1__5140@NODE_271_length_10278_cov_119_025561_g236_i0_p6_GENE_NODE_271_length_10278_cov_119_025561_g236_i0NODE_271_length_10278_cov_119_025561_g236_i0_p6_ORF_typecomplete_len217_score31_55NUDIX/PF00293_28/2_3e07_NODE_271_length_10278_cov_119_025561_g236_i012151865